MTSDTAFKDRNGKEYVIDFTLASLMRIRTKCGIDMMSIVEANGEDLYIRLRTEPEIIIRVVYHAIENDLIKSGFATLEDFAEVMGGDSIAEARDALMKAFSFFLPDQKNRENFQRVEEAQKKMFRIMQERITEEINKKMTDEGINQICDEAMSSAMRTESRGTSA